MNRRLENKVALVTGGAAGIGAAIVRRFVAEGARVLIGDRDQPAGSALAAELGAATAFQGLDVADAGSFAAALDRTVALWGRLDVLVNNAGIAMDQILLRIKPEELERTMAVNVGGTLWCCKAAMRVMIRKRQGRIVNLTSVVGETGNPGQAVYAASKAGIIGLTKTLAREYASRGVTVNAVAPGFIETDMTASLPEPVKEAAIAQTPLGRMGSPADVAAAVLYLVSDEAGFVTGQVIRVNGGMHV